VAKLRYHLKRIFPEGDIMEIKIWEVPRSEDFPEGVRYSLVYIKMDEEGARRVLGYDNERGKGHHRHHFGREERISFHGWEELVRMFLDDVRKLRREMYEG